MKESNFDRMVSLASETFAAHNDPDQLNITEESIKLLEQIHPATLSEYNEGDGPVVWILLIPTNSSLMNEFIKEKISEDELLNKTPLNIKYDALYLCSALVLPEFRKKGLAKKTALDAIFKIRKDHPIKILFTWNFSKEGALLSESIANHESLPLMHRERRIE